jgi:hypothetical protein
MHGCGYRQQPDRIERLKLHSRNIRADLFTRRSDDADTLEALLRDEEVDALDTRIERDVELVQAIGGLWRARPEHDFAVAVRKRLSATNPEISDGAKRNTEPPVASAMLTYAGSTVPWQGQPG